MTRLIAGILLIVFACICIGIHGYKERKLKKKIALIY